MYSLFGWSDMLQAPASARVPGEPHFLFVPAGFMWDEVTASSLVKITVKGDVVSQTPFGTILDAWYPVQAIHEVRADANFVIHTHDAYAVALSARKEGLLPISQTAAIVLGTKLAIHEYEGVETYESAIPGLQRSLGDASAMILRHHGAMVLGRTAFEAVFRMDQLLLACRTQILAGDPNNLLRLPETILATFPYEIERAAQAPSPLWSGLLRRLDEIDPSYRN
jgi:ribulose-5-phosphate 4-epimerase/fuculose-1-phosphate aldolase